MWKNTVCVGLLLACSACSHLPFMRHTTPPAAAPVAASPATPADPSTAAASDPLPRPALPGGIAAPPGYETVAAARRSLEAREDVQTHADPQGWWIVEIPAEHMIWAFTPDDHPAHPAAVAREAVNEHGIIRIRMAVLCTASKEACDALVEEFKPVNEEMRKRLQENL